MIPPPHGFAPADYFIGYEKNITFLGRELCRSSRQSGPPRCPLLVKRRHQRRADRCPLYPSKQTSLSAIAISALCHNQT